jgi:hypothetical protein
MSLAVYTRLSVLETKTRLSSDLLTHSGHDEECTALSETHPFARIHILSTPKI